MAFSWSYALDIIRIKYTYALDIIRIKYTYDVVAPCYVAVRHDSDVNIGQWRLKSPAFRLFTQPFVQVQIKENIKSASLAFVRGILRSPVNSPYKGPVTRKMHPLDDVIMIIVCSRFIWCLDWNIPRLIHWLWGNGPSAGEVILGWGLLSQFPPFRYFPNFPSLSKQTLVIEYHVYIWEASPQLGCGDSCQIWMLFKESNRYFRMIENFAYGQINKRSFSNPHPWTICAKLKLNHVKPQKHAHRLHVYSDVLQWFIMSKLYRRFVRWMAFLPNYALRHIATLIFYFRLITLLIL